MTVATKTLRDKYDGKGPDFVSNKETLTPNAIYLLLSYDFHTMYDEKMEIMQELPSIKEAIAYIGYGLMASELTHSYIEDTAIDLSYYLNYFIYDADDDLEYWDSREEFLETDFASGEEDLKLWIERIDKLVDPIFEPKMEDLDELIKDYSMYSGFFNIIERGDINTFFKSENIKEKIQSFANSYITNKGSDINYPFLVLRTLLNQDCFDPTNEKHEKIASYVLYNLID